MTVELTTQGLEQAAFLDLVRSRRATRSFADRPLTMDEITRNRLSAAHYVANWKRYATGWK